MARLKPVKHDEHLSLVDHLDELRTRIIYSLGFLAVAFAVCFWQSDVILDVAAAPLPEAHKALVVLAPTEAFMTTVTVCAYAAIIVSAPFISYQVFAYILPAFSPRERRAILPMLFTIPLLFLVGCVFAYFVVLPAAINFLLSFNGEQFAIQLRAREYYSFFSMTLLAGGVVFELPIVILALVRLRILTVDQLRQNRRYAYLICAVIAAALPGVDPISMLIETVPLLVLYELSILLARGIGQPKESAESQIPSIQEN
ncbi:MAG TPA: twin-arginine translocase subunit TatC [Solirubrobacterales bacterium]|nr:twin-arginine translocase subunit TatC [Solirubrobacterales bacterium]HMU28308.1 twin-arginine translocase subunit TatC [Solirubrobacterales bacterium]HMW44683.1 twin-arginine translocase subunit TatC [Solirubrobacterales bacterium]HMX71196.1 twin-arginine translocase subunit TatC [Solirubrobacterales bacterium]HMY25124.1 twin-arginine translocase subunit TatC [Solirubrobacterales bacterium]